MPSSVDRPVGEPSVAFCINLTELGSTLMGAGFFFLWFYCVFSSTLALPTALGHVHALRASGAYNPVPGWLGPGAWLAYWLTTLTALARAARALFSERTLATESTEPDADEAWDPDLTASALFTLFASVALLGDSRARADIEPNLLVLCAESLAVLAGVCTGYLGSGFWLGVLLDSPPREVRLSAPGPLVRTALRRIATYSVLLVGSASVLLVFSLRMSSSALLTAARERGSRAVLVYDTLGSIARLAVYLLLEFAFRMAAVAAIFASGNLMHQATSDFVVPFIPSTLWLGLVLLVMGIPGIPSFPNSAVSILELDQLAPLVTAGLVAAVRVFYLMRQSRARDGARAAARAGPV